MIHVVLHAAALLGLGGVLWLSGRVFLVLLGDLGAWRHLASICLGLAWWSSGLFVIAATGFLNGWGLGLTGLPLLPLAVVLRRRNRMSTHGNERLRPSPAERAFAVFLAVLLGLVFLLTISPQVSWDADVYHLTLPRLYLEDDGFRDVPMSVYSHWPQGTELLFAAAMLVGDYMLAKAVHFGFGLLTIYALFLALSTEKSRIGAWLAVTFFLANEVVASEVFTAYVDLAHAFFFLAAFLFLHRALEEEGERSDAFLLLAGLCCGLMAGVKVTGIVGAGVIGALYVPRLVAAARSGQPRSHLSSFAARFVLPVLLLWTPWLGKAAVFTGNPFYPFFHGWLGGPDWSSTLAERFGAWQSSIGMGRGALDYLLLPIRAVLLGGRGYPHFDGELSPFWIVLVPLAAVLGRRAPLVRRALVAAGLFFVFWALSSQQARFLIPVLAVLAIVGADAVSRLLDRLPHLRWREGHVLAVAALLLLTVYAFYLAGGFRTMLVFLQFEGDLAATTVPEHHAFIDENLPGDARLLFVNTNLGFFCRRPYLADSFFEASQIADWLGRAGSVEEVRQRLGERGVTHVVIDARPRVDNFPPPLIALLNDPREVVILFRSSDDRFTVLGLR